MHALERHLFKLNLYDENIIKRTCIFESNGTPRSGTTSKSCSSWLEKGVYLKIFKTSLLNWPRLKARNGIITEIVWYPIQQAARHRVSHKGRLSNFNLRRPGYICQTLINLIVWTVQYSPYRTTACLYWFSQPQKTDRAFIFPFQRWIKVFVISLRPWLNFAWWIPKFGCCYFKAWPQRVITKKERGLLLQTKATAHSSIMLTWEHS